jgi:hypothetical protein
LVVPTNLVNIVRRQIATPEVEKSLGSLQVKGKARVEEFFHDRLVEGQENKFWDVLP